MKKRRAARAISIGGVTVGGVAPIQWGLLAYLGVIASGLCFFLWDRGATRVGAGTLALMNNLKIPLGAVVSIVVLKERYNLRTLLASLGIFLAALALCRRAERQMRG